MGGDTSVSYTHLDVYKRQAFGDATNDRGMLRWAKWSFSMANAHEPARNAARYKTASNEEDGVAQAIERYVL